MRNGQNTTLAAICSLFILSVSASATRSIADSPACAKNCQAVPALNEVPLCAMNPLIGAPKPSEADLKNTFSCLCTDKNMLKQNLPCILKECASDPKSIEVWFTQTYDECNRLGGVQYPSPPDFLKALNVAIPSNVTIPTTISGVPQATSFPSSTATTVPLPNGVTAALSGGASDHQSVTTESSSSGGSPFDASNGAVSDSMSFGVPAIIAGVLALVVIL